MRNPSRSDSVASEFLYLICAIQLRMDRPEGGALFPLPVSYPVKREKSGTKGPREQEIRNERASKPRHSAFG